MLKWNFVCLDNTEFSFFAFNLFPLFLTSLQNVCFHVHHWMKWLSDILCLFFYNLEFSNCYFVSFLTFNLLSGEAQEDTTELGSNYGILPVHTHFSLHSYLQVLYTRLTVFFDEGGKPENPEKNPRGMRKNNTLNKLSSHMTRAGIEPGPQRWKASALTTKQPMPPLYYKVLNFTQLLIEMLKFNLCLCL